MSHSDTLPPDIVWKVSGQDDLIWRAWSGSYVVYHPLSGDTQFLDISAVQVLKSLEHSGACEDELCAVLAAFLDVENDDEIRKAISQIIGKLDDLGIIEPVYR